MERFQDLFIFIAAGLSGMFGVLAHEVSFLARPLSPVKSETTVMFVGDMMFDRSVRTTMETNGADFILSCIREELVVADMVVGNLEGPITTNPSRSVGSVVGSPDNFVFTFPSYVAPLLFRHNVQVVSLGNNHIYNFGADGVAETVRSLRDANVGYFGEPGGQSVSDVESHGVLLSFIGYNEFDSGWHASTTLTQIIDARGRGRMPIVFAHWGDEYVGASERQRTLAHRFIDAGAELVIGSHPHVIQEAEVYAGKHIYYSLGNFIFDQYWNPAVRTGLTVTAVFDEAGVRDVREAHVVLERDRRTCPGTAS